MTIAIIGLCSSLLCVYFLFKQKKKIKALINDNKLQEQKFKDLQISKTKPDAVIGPLKSYQTPIEYKIISEIIKNYPPIGKSTGINPFYVSYSNAKLLDKLGHDEKRPYDDLEVLNKKKLEIQDDISKLNKQSIDLDKSIKVLLEERKSLQIETSDLSEQIASLELKKKLLLTP